MADNPPGYKDFHDLKNVDLRTGVVTRNHKVEKVFLEMQKLIGESYDEIVEEHSRRDSGIAGENHEQIWRTLFKKWLPHLPSRTKVTILGPDGDYSPEVDLVLLKPNYPEILLEKNRILSGGVIAAFECKLTFRQRDLADIILKAKSVKRMAAPHREAGFSIKENVYPYLFGAFPYGLLCASHEWKAEGSVPFENADRNFRDKIWAIPDHPSEVVDLICIADVAHWATRHFINRSSPRLTPEMRAHKLGVVSSTLGGTSKDACAGLMLDLIARLAKQHKIDGWILDFVSQATGQAGTPGGTGPYWRDQTFPSDFVAKINAGNISISDII